MHKVIRFRDRDNKSLFFSVLVDGDASISGYRDFVEDFRSECEDSGEFFDGIEEALKEAFPYSFLGFIDVDTVYI